MLRLVRQVMIGRGQRLLEIMNLKDSQISQALKPIRLHVSIESDQHQNLSLYKFLTHRDQLFS